MSETRNNERDWAADFARSTAARLEERRRLAEESRRGIERMQRMLDELREEEERKLRWARFFRLV